MISLIGFRFKRALFGLQLANRIESYPINPRMKSPFSLKDRASLPQVKPILEFISDCGGFEILTYWKC
ncbi:hypothetical protein CEXT_58021 [Caerostris extrusa]|uniref:Uncharacterized protein n=1 Tax=Caerostris extrusa TaxID=172846 RepID=A0AAV4QWB4_CAEEX|nr:hypothetical protein CEXT_58021 [Caerostris extrusa]